MRGGKSFPRTSVFFLLWFAILGPSAHAWIAKTVESGDLFEIGEGSKPTVWISLLGVSAPKKGQESFSRSRDSLQRSLGKYSVDIQYLNADKCLRGFPDRCVRSAKVLANGRDVGLFQIEIGQAWHDHPHFQDQSTTDRALYSEAERNARQKKLGLWRKPNPQAPWTWVPPPSERKLAATKKKARPAKPTKKSKPKEKAKASH